MAKAVVVALLSSVQVVDAGLPKLANHSEAVSFVRRLSGHEASQKGVMSAACAAACPDIKGSLENSQYKTNFEAVQAKYGAMGEAESMKHMGAMITDMMLLTNDAVCEHKDIFECAAQNPDACIDDSGQDQTGFSDTIKHSTCLCETCPSLKTGYAHFQGTIMGTFVTAMMAAFAGMGQEGGSAPAINQEEIQTKLMTAMCALVSGLECSNQNKDTCSGLFDQAESGSGGGGMTLDTSMLNDVAALKAQCQSQGLATDASALTSSVQSGEGTDVSGAPVAVGSALALGTALAVSITV